MQIPDSIVFASIPIVTGSLLWAAKQFVKDNQGEKGERGERGEQGRAAPGITVRDYKELSEMLINIFNGRYMLATESRERFENLERKIDNINEHLLRGKNE